MNFVGPVHGVQVAVGDRLAVDAQRVGQLLGAVEVGVLGPVTAEGLAKPFGLPADEILLPLLALEQIAMIGAFTGYAGGGGLGNATYSNFVRDKGWGMGSLVGAIPSAVGGTHISLSHLGTVFRVTDENLRRWRGWWRCFHSRRTRRP